MKSASSLSVSHKKTRNYHEEKTKFQTFKTKFNKYKMLYLLIIPAIVSVGLFHYYPLYGVQIAFKDYRSSLGILGSEWVGFEHFIRFLTYPDFFEILKNTIIISLYSLAMFPLPVIFALMLNEVKNAKYKKSIQMITYAPHFVSTIVVCSMCSLFLDKDTGIIALFLQFFGVSPINYLDVPVYFSSIFVWSEVWQTIGWSSIIYIAALSSVPTEMVEAARIDGATRFKIITKINIPTILPTIVIMLILRMGQIMNVGFEKAFALQTPLNLDASRIISTYVYEIGVVGGQFSYSTAIGLFNSIVNIILVIIVNQISKKVTSVGLW